MQKEKNVLPISLKDYPEEILENGVRYIRYSACLGRVKFMHEMQT